MYSPAAQTSPELIFHIIKCWEQASVLLSVMYATLENVSEKERKNQLNNTYLHKFNFSLKDINMS